MNLLITNTINIFNSRQRCWVPNNKLNKSQYLLKNQFAVDKNIYLL